MQQSTSQATSAQESLTNELAEIVDDTESYFTWMRGISEYKAMSKTARLIGTRLALHRNAKTGQCNPSYQMLADEIGVDRGTAIRAVNSMVKGGWLVDPDSGGGRSNNFVLMIPPNGGTSATVSNADGGSSATVDSGTSATIDGATVAPAPPNSGTAATEQWRQRHPNDKEGQTNDRAALHAAPCPRIDRVVTKPVTGARRFEFRRLTHVYPKNKVSDEAKALAAFELALDAGHRWVKIVTAVLDQIRDRKPFPDLVDWITLNFPASTSPSIQPALEAAE